MPGECPATDASSADIGYPTVDEVHGSTMTFAFRFPIKSRSLCTAKCLSVKFPFYALFLIYPIARWLFSKILNSQFLIFFLVFFFAFFDDKMITIRLHSKVDATWIAASPANCSIVYKSEKMFTLYKKEKGCKALTSVDVAVWFEATGVSVMSSNGSAKKA